MKRIIIILLLISLPVFAQLPTNPYGFNDIPLYENCFSPADGDSLFIRNVTKRIGWISTTYTAPDVNDWHVLEIVSLDGTYYFKDSMYVKNTTNLAGACEQPPYELNETLLYDTWYRWRVTAKRTGYQDSYTKWRSFKTQSISVPKVPTFTTYKGYTDFATLYNIDGFWVRAFCGGRGDYFAVDRRYSGEDPRYPVDTYAFEIRKVSDNSLIHLTDDRVGNHYYTYISWMPSTSISTYPTGYYGAIENLNLSYSTQYKVRAIVKNAVGTNTSDWITFTTVSAPSVPLVSSAPILLIPTNNSKNIERPITFRWRKVSNATGYYLKLEGNGHSRFFTVADTVCNFNQYLDKGKLYTWSVAGYNSNGTGAWNSSSFTTKYPVIPPTIITPQPPSAPILILPGIDSTDIQNPILFKWHRATGAKKYYLKVEKDATFLFSFEIVDTFYLMKFDLEKNATFTWSVSAINDYGSSVFSTRSFTTKADVVIPPVVITTKPTVPTLLSPADNSVNIETPILFRWRKISNADSYYWYLKKDGIQISSADVLDTSYSYEGVLEENKVYTWEVNGYNSFGFGDSIVFSFSTKINNAIPPSNIYTPVLLSPIDNATNIPLIPTFKWVKNDSVTSYTFELYREDTLKYSTNLRADSLVLPSLVLEQKNSITYKWHVKATNSVGIGTSSWFYFTTISDSIPIPPGSPSVSTLLLPIDNATRIDTPITFKWSESTNATGYSFFLYSGDNILLSSITGISDTIYNFHSNLISVGKRYKWKIRSENSIDSSLTSTSTFFTTEPIDSTDIPGITYTADFTDNQYDSTIWGFAAPSCDKNTIAQNKIVTVDDGSCAEWYKKKFQAIESSTISDIDFSGKFWWGSGSPGIGQYGLAISPSNSDNVYISITAFNDEDVYGYYYNNGTDSLWSLGLDLSALDSNRVYRITYQRSTDEVEFFYKANENITSWTKVGTTYIFDLDTLHLIPSYFAASGAYAGEVYGDDLSLVYTPYQEPQIDTFAFQIPTKTVYFGNEILDIKWMTTKDSVQLFLMGDTVTVTDSSHYKIIVPDSNFTLIIRGAIINPLLNSISSDTLQFFCYKNRFIEIDTAYQSRDTLTYVVISSGLDSLAFYLEQSDSTWYKLGRKIVDKTYTPNITTFQYYLYNSSIVCPCNSAAVGKQTFGKSDEPDNTGECAADWRPILEEIFDPIADTTYTIRNMILTCSPPFSADPNRGKGGCHGWFGTPWALSWSINLSCGWIADSSGGYWSHGVYYPRVSNHQYYEGTSDIFIPNVPDLTFGINRVWNLVTTTTTFEGHGNTISKSSSTVINAGSFDWSVSDYIVRLTSKLTGLSRSFDLRQLDLAGWWSSGMIHPPFNITVKHIHGELRMVNGILTSVNAKPTLWIGSSRPAAALFYIFEVDSRLGWTIEETIDNNTGLFDTWDFGEVGSEVKVRRNYFRGIHPKIWKYGNPQGIKP